MFNIYENKMIKSKIRHSNANAHHLTQNSEFQTVVALVTQLVNGIIL